MSRHGGSTDSTNFVVLRPAITRAFWSKRRAWNGAKLSLTVETRFVEDGTELAIDVWESDEKEGNPDDAIETIPGPCKVKDGRCVIEHELKWDAKKLGEEIATEGGELEFYFRVKIPRFELQARSNMLYVDLGGFTVSG
jgi:hypothetical protein